MIIPSHFSPQKILVIRLSALGDNVLAIPAVQLLAQKFPKAEIHWLTEMPYVPILTGVTGVTPIAYDKKGADRGLRGLLRLRQRLANDAYDLVVDLQDKPKTAILRGISPVVVAYRKRTMGEALKSLIVKTPPFNGPHATEAMANALRPLGIELPKETIALEQSLRPHLMATNSMISEANAAGIFGKLSGEITEVPQNDKPSFHRLGIVGIAPGARWATKRWPAERFGTLARRLEDLGHDILLLGGCEDRDAFQTIRRHLAHPERTLDTSTLSVGGLMGALSTCNLCISCDSGPAHIAAALGIPTLAIFGPTSFQRWAPRGPFTQVATLNLPCSPCSNFGGRTCPLGNCDCMSKLEVSTVERLALNLLKTANASKSMD